MSETANLQQKPVDFTKDNLEPFNLNDNIKDQGNGSNRTDDSSSVTHTGHKKTESLTQVDKVRIAAKLLRQIPHCSKIHPITGARVPIGRFSLLKYSNFKYFFSELRFL